MVHIPTFSRQGANTAGLIYELRAIVRVLPSCAHTASPTALRALANSAFVFGGRIFATCSAALSLAWYVRKSFNLKPLVLDFMYWAARPSFVLKRRSSLSLPSNRD